MSWDGADKGQDEPDQDTDEGDDRKSLRTAFLDREKEVRGAELGLSDGQLHKGDGGLPDESEHFEIRTP